MIFVWQLRWIPPPPYKYLFTTRSGIYDGDTHTLGQSYRNRPQAAPLGGSIRFTSGSPTTPGTTAQEPETPLTSLCPLSQGATGPAQRPDGKFNWRERGLRSIVCSVTFRVERASTLFPADPGGWHLRGEAPGSAPLEHSYTHHGSRFGPRSSACFPE